MKGLMNSTGELNFEETWGILQSALTEMHTKNASTLSFEAIYRHAYKIVLRKKGDLFYDRLQSFEKGWLGNSVHAHLCMAITRSLTAPASVASATPNERRQHGERFLSELKTAFEDHQLVMNMATDVFMYLDRVYCTDQRKPNIFTSGMLQFRDHVMRKRLPDIETNMQAVLINVILDQIGMERDGDAIERSLIKSCVNVLEGLHETAAENEDERLYLTCFEEKFLQASRMFYRNESSRLIADTDAASYCRHTKKRINEEKSRCQTTLSEDTRAKIIKVLEEELILHKIAELIQVASGVQHMIENNRFDDLKLVYELNARVDASKAELTKAIQRRVHEVFNQINDAALSSTQPQPQQPASTPTPAQGDAKGKSRPSGDRAANNPTTAALQWVEAVLTVKDKYDHIWTESLSSDAVIQPALTRSFTEAINTFPRCSEFISLFIDENMKKGLKNKSEAETDRVLEKAIVLLRYIVDKDMFERYYKKHLCKRLLMNKSLSVDVEREMIRKMKVELGNSFVSKLESMFKDMQLSEDLSNSYRKHVSDSGSSSNGKRVDISVHVLTSMTWPLESMQASSKGDADEAGQCIFPLEVDQVRKGFEDYYNGKFSGRKLSWLAHMGTADIRSFFPKVQGAEGKPEGKDRRYELNVSTHSMLILLLFNDLPPGDNLTTEQIQTRTNIPKGELVRNLQSLALGKAARVLLKEPSSKEVNASDRFSVNQAFYSQYTKFKIGLVASSGNKVEDDKERRDTEDRNNETRKFQIDAAAVRVMKSRKECAHQQLVAEVLSQLASKFKPEVSMIKARIDDLLEREYLERIEDTDPPAYRYLA